MATQVDEDQLGHDEIVEYLTHLCDYAKKQQHITARFATDRPTDWDRAHDRINSALDDLALSPRP